jgi:hypothetical protein
VGVVGVFLGADTTHKTKIIRVLGLRLRTAPVVARDVHGIYVPWDSAPVSVDGVWLGGWYVACGGGGSKTPVMGPTNKARGPWLLLSSNMRPLSPIAAEALSPAVFVYTSVQREPAPGGPGSGLRPGRRRFLCQLPLWFYIYIWTCANSSSGSSSSGSSTRGSNTGNRGCARALLLLEFSNWWSVLLEAFKALKRAFAPG